MLLRESGRSNYHKGHYCAVTLDGWWIISRLNGLKHIQLLLLPLPQQQLLLLPILLLSLLLLLLPILLLIYLSILTNVWYIRYQYRVYTVYIQMPMEFKTVGEKWCGQQHAQGLHHTTVLEGVTRCIVLSNPFWTSAAVHRHAQQAGNDWIYRSHFGCDHIESSIWILFWCPPKRVKPGFNGLVFER